MHANIRFYNYILHRFVFDLSKSSLNTIITMNVIKIKEKITVADGIRTRNHKHSV